MMAFVAISPVFLILLVEGPLFEESLLIKLLGTFGKGLKPRLYISVLNTAGILGLDCIEKLKRKQGLNQGSPNYGPQSVFCHFCLSCLAAGDSSLCRVGCFLRTQIKTNEDFFFFKLEGPLLFCFAVNRTFYCN